MNPIIHDRCRACGDSILLGFYDGSRYPQWRHVLSALETHAPEPDTLAIRSVWNRYEREVAR